MSTAEDFMTFEEFAERFAYQVIFNIYHKEHTRLATRSSRSESSSAAPGTLYNPVSQSSRAESRRHEIETLKTIGNGKKQCKYPKHHQDTCFYCKTCSISCKIHVFGDFKSAFICAYNHVI